MQFQTKFWPDDNTVPESALPLLDLIGNLQNKEHQGQTVVHCL